MEDFSMTKLIFRKLAAALAAGLFLFSTGAMAASGFHCPSGEHYYHSTGTCIK
jgi:hypothetical protein